jgi:hypothetical protein
MNRQDRFSAIAAIVIIALTIGGWTVVMGTASKATVRGHASQDVQRTQSPSMPTLPALW